MQREDIHGFKRMVWNPVCKGGWHWTGDRGMKTMTHHLCVFKEENMVHVGDPHRKHHHLEIYNGHSHTRMFTKLEKTYQSYTLLHDLTHTFGKSCGEMCNVRKFFWQCWMPLKIWKSQSEGNDFEILDSCGWLCDCLSLWAQSPYPVLKIGLYRWEAAFKKRSWFSHSGTDTRATLY